MSRHASEDRIAARVRMAETGEPYRVAIQKVESPDCDPLVSIGQAADYLNVRFDLLDGLIRSQRIEIDAGPPRRVRWSSVVKLRTAMTTA